jgi:sulfur-oxidizing protein SoxB
MMGGQIKDILEDIADNLFNPDPYYQQGGDMVRVGGMDYTCAPAERIGRRISDMTLNDGTAVEAGKRYRVAGWASVNPQTGKPVMDVVADYLRAKKVVKLTRPNRVALRGVAGNPGYAEEG